MVSKPNSGDPDRDLAYFRFALIAPVIQGNFPDASIAAYCRRVAENPIRRPDGTLFHYSPATIEKWVSQYRESGMDALLPKDRSDKGSVRVLSDDCINEIYRLKEMFPKLDAVQIHLRLVQEQFIPATVSVRTIQRFIKSRSLTKPVASGIAKERKAFEMSCFGEMWQADTCYFPHITDSEGRKKRTFLICILDDHSRMIVGARLFYEDNAYNFQKVLRDAVSTYGIPAKLYVDHGASFENSQLAFICGSIGTSLIHTPVRDGASKGKIERSFGVLKSRWLHGLDISQIRYLDDFNLHLNEAVREHNLTVNSSTKQTPMERFLASRERIRLPRSEEWLAECFMNRVKRKVRNDSTVSISNLQFDAPMQFMRQTVEIRFLPDRLDEAYILENGTRFPLKLTDRQANSKVKRASSFPSLDYSKGVVFDA